MPGSDPVRFTAGDVLVFPDEDPYAIVSRRGERPELNHENALQFFRAMAQGELPFVVTEGEACVVVHR